VVHSRASEYISVSSCYLQCDRSEAVSNLLATIMDSTEEDLVAVLSVECSTATLPIGEISHYFSLTTVSPYYSPVCLWCNILKLIFWA